MKTAPHVLIIEDKPDADRLALHQLLAENHGDKIEMITDGQQGWDRLSRPDTDASELVAVMLDLNLTSLSGLEVLRRIRADPRLRNLFVVVMTDETSDADMKACIALGVTSFVKKPITLASFTKAIADSFHDSRAAQQEIQRD